MEKEKGFAQPDQHKNSSSNDFVNTDDTEYNTSQNAKVDELDDETQEDLISKIKELNESLTQSKDQLLREKAEAENLRKRFAKELEEARKYAISDFALTMTEILENLYRALDSFPQDKKEHDLQFKNLFDGVSMTQKMMLDSFAKYNVKRIYPNVGEKFDHNVHQAISKESNEEVEMNHVVKVINAGYTMGERLLRPAMVIVSNGA